MEIQKTDWNGFEKWDFIFEGKKAILVVPDQPDEKKRWLFKTEYFGAFPDFELEMVKRGFFLAYVENTTRWCLPEDTDRQAAFANFLHREFGLHPQCMTVGMSCGGMQAVYLAAKYPQVVAAVYADAPVMNYLSCPCGIGAAGSGMYDEFVKNTGLTVSRLINDRHQPVDYIDNIIRSKIPVFLVCGDSDTIVPFEENGSVLYEKMKEANADITLVLKKGCNHHPHGLTDNTPLIAFAERCYS